MQFSAFDIDRQLDFLDLDFLEDDNKNSSDNSFHSSSSEKQEDNEVSIFSTPKPSFVPYTEDEVKVS